MAAALVLPVSGPYSCTWAGFALGVQNDDGFVLSGAYTGQEVNQSDAYGMTLVEAIWRGLNWRIRFRGLEWNRPGILAAIQAFGSTGDSSNTFTPLLDNIGDRYSRYSNPLTMASILPVQPQGAAFGSSGNPAFINGLTALSAIIAPQSNTEAMFTSKVREAPLEMVLLPYVYTVGSLTNQNLSFTTS